VLVSAGRTPGAGPTIQTPLRARLLVELGFLTSAAVLVVGVATAIVAGSGAEQTALSLIALWAGSTLVFVVFGAHLLRRVVLQPLQALANEADALARGQFETGSYEAPEFAQLAERYRVMAQNLLDVRSEIVRVEKLAGIGSLAAGVAHEVRNPLGAVGTYVDVLRRRGTDPEVTAAMRGAIERIERTVQSLLVYARPGDHSGVADVNEAVSTATAFLSAQGLLNERNVTVRLEAPVSLVRCDQHRLEQLVVNLVVNACHAAPGGVVTVGTDREVYGARAREDVRRSDLRDGPATAPRSAGWTPRPRRTDVEPGTEGVLLYVADRGPGVPEELRERIFDPFFTTKAPGEGTGLGLAIVARTVHEAGGTVWVDRAREGGAVFKVFLPTAPAAEADREILEPMHAAAHR
jgi:two-component system NtrC family sensor kinase